MDIGEVGNQDIPNAAAPTKGSQPVALTEVVNGISVTKKDRV
jgi:hypothetical protein